MKKIWILSVIGLIFILLLIALPYIAKWYLEKNDKELIGREITLHDVDLNLFTATLTLNGLHMYEANDQDIFLSCDAFTCNLNPWPLLKKKILLTTVLLENPSITFLQNGDHLNIDDLLAADTTATEDTTSSSLAWQVDNFRVLGGTVIYEDHQLKSHIQLDSLKIQSKPIYSDQPEIALSIDAQDGTGNWQADILLDQEKEQYQVSSHAHDWSLAPLLPYLQQGMKLKEFAGLLHTNLDLSGSYANTDDFSAKGLVGIGTLQMTSQNGDTLVAWNDFSIDVTKIDNKTQQYNFRKILLVEPYLNVAVSDSSNNFTDAMVSTDTTTNADADTTQANYEIEYANPFEYLAFYLYDLTQDYVYSNYVADTISIENGSLDYADYSLPEIYTMQLTALNALASGVSKEDEFVDFALNSKVNTVGDFKGELKMSRLGLENMIFNFQVSNLMLDSFNPYSTYYTAHPFSNGNIIFTSKNTIEKYYLKSDNNLFIEKILLGEKVDTDAQYNLPMKLAVALLRDQRGDVDLKVPVEGQLNDPNYKMGKVILQVLKNIIVKVASAPYKLLANAIGGNEEDLKAVNFTAYQQNLPDEQKRKLRSVAKVLKQKPEFKIKFTKIQNKEEELQTIALVEARKSYLSDQGIASQDTSLKMMEEVKANDSLFFQFMQKSLKLDDSVKVDTSNATAMCRQFIGEEKLKTIYDSLWSKRQTAIAQYLTQETELSEDRWKFNEPESKNKEAATTQPHYQITYGIE